MGRLARSPVGMTPRCTAKQCCAVWGAEEDRIFVLFCFVVLHDIAYAIDIEQILKKDPPYPLHLHISTLKGVWDEQRMK